MNGVDAKISPSVAGLRLNVAEGKGAFVPHEKFDAAFWANQLLSVNTGVARSFRTQFDSCVTGKSLLA